MKRHYITSIILFLSLSGLNLPAATYRWLDDDGHVVYSQAPPSDGRNYREISAPPPPAGDPEATRKRLEEAHEALTGDRKAQEQQKQEGDRKKVQAERRRQNCEAARKDLATLTSRPPNTLFKVGDKEYRRFTPEERQARIDHLKKVIEENCKGE